MVTMDTKIEAHMETIENPDGFLIEMSHWTREIAEELARRNDIGPVTEDHWKVIEYVRDYYQERKGNGSELAQRRPPRMNAYDDIIRELVSLGSRQPAHVV